MPLPDSPIRATRPSTIRAERVEALLASERHARRESCRLGTFIALVCFGWCAVGLLMLGMAVHVTDELVGRAWFWGGLIVGNVGMLVTLAWGYLRGEARGLW